jgi:hypothetical protein
MDMALEVVRDVSVQAPADKVWSLVGGFGSLDAWHPAIASCEIEEIEGTTHRRLKAVDGDELLEKLLAHDDASMAYTYSIESSPLPVKGYVAEVRVAAEDGGARLTWSSRFLPDGVSDAEAQAVIAEIYEAGLTNVQAMLA